MIKQVDKKHHNELFRSMADGNFTETSDGGVLVRGQALIKGIYTHSVNGKDVRQDANMIPAAGILHILDVVFRNQTRYASWYIALYSGTTAVATSWTAGNFTATATEITSGTEGYSEATRQVWTPSAASSGAINNIASPATFTIATASTITVRGMALLSDSAKGSTSGVLASAVQLASARTLSNGETFQAQYQISLVDTD